MSNRSGFSAGGTQRCVLVDGEVDVLGGLVLVVGLVAVVFVVVVGFVEPVVDVFVVVFPVVEDLHAETSVNEAMPVPLTISPTSFRNSRRLISPSFFNIKAFFDVFFAM